MEIPKLGNRVNSTLEDYVRDEGNKYVIVHTCNAMYFVGVRRNALNNRKTHKHKCPGCGVILKLPEQHFTSKFPAMPSPNWLESLTDN